MEVVGQIQSHDVVYVPERDQIFCKNTSVNYPLIERLVRSGMSKESIPEKKLTITKDNGIVSLGCLTTTMENLLNIRKQVLKIKKNGNIR